MKRFIFVIAAFLLAMPAWGQYAPQAGVAGSTAISSSSSLFTGWASACTLQRGYINIDSPSLGLATYGTSLMALGIADHGVVSLGDSGVADLTFPGYIYNGPGADFAVFENGFINGANDSQAFLELAFVEVSSDGVNYARFPAHSLTQVNTQIPGSGVYMYANLLDNLAGKYGSGYGTPFDLDDVPAMAWLDKSRITNVRVIDVVGAIGRHAAHDATGNIINDPYPTNFATGGFDLDAVGVIHRLANDGVQQLPNGISLNIYPNPSAGSLFIDAVGNTEGLIGVLTSVTGTVARGPFDVQNKTEIGLGDCPAGLYYLTIQDSNGNKWVGKVTRL